MSRRVINLLIGIISLCVGGATYVMFRPNSYITKWIGIDVFSNYEFIKAFHPISYYLADLLWALSLGCLLVTLFFSKKRGIIFCSFVAFFTGLTWEMLQWMDIVSGTGDFIDVFMYFLSALLVVIINIKETLK